MIEIGNSIISSDRPTYFIADIAANHDQDLERAKVLIKLAAESGADAVKFQHFKAETIVSDKGFRELGNNLSHQSNWKVSVFETYKKAELPIQWIAELSICAEENGVDFFTAPYSLELIDQVEPYIPAFKIGSGEITWIHAIEKMASFGKPILLATGASNFEDVSRAVDAIRKYHNKIILMQCNTNYTGGSENIQYLNLNVLLTYKKSFDKVELGLSDHTEGYLSVIAAVALGARAIEKHFTDDSLREGPDHKFSLTPKIWKEMVSEVRRLESALGDGVKKVEMNENFSRIVQQRSIYYAENMLAGKELDIFDFDILRPAPENNLRPFELSNLIGKKLKTDVLRHDAVNLYDIE